MWANRSTYIYSFTMLANPTPTFFLATPTPAFIHYLAIHNTPTFEATWVVYFLFPPTLLHLPMGGTQLLLSRPLLNGGIIKAL